MSSSTIPIRSFSVTFRPLSGVTDDHLKIFMLWVNKHCQYFHVVTEKLGVERHIHAGLFLKKKKARSNMLMTLTRLYPDLSFEEKRVFQQGVKSMYNFDWISNYLAKGDDTAVIGTNLPEAGHLEDYFSEVPLPAKKGPATADPYYSQLERLWYLHSRPGVCINPPNIRDFLMDLMNNKRIIRVVADNRKIFQISIALSRYMNKETSFKPEPEPFHQDV